MKRVWLNHWFSTAYNIVKLIKENESNIWLIGSNENEHSVYRSVCDEWYVEPVLKEAEYVEYCLSFCKEHNVDLFLPRRGMVAISKNKERFDAIGTTVMVENSELMDMLNDKAKSYEFFRQYEWANVPEYHIVTDVAHFKRAYEDLVSKYKHVCFKFVHDEGGKSYRLIDNNRKGYTALFKKQSTRMTYDEVIIALSEREKFSPIMVMPYLPDEEVSVDCLRTEKGIIMLPRIKDATRVEKVRYDKIILDKCKKVFETIDLQCPCNIQFKYLEGKPYFLEINTRMSGGIQMACLASGVNIPNIAVNKFLGIDKFWTCSEKEVCISHVEIPVIV